MKLKKSTSNQLRVACMTYSDILVDLGTVDCESNPYTCKQMGLLKFNPAFKMTVFMFQKAY